LEPYSINTYHLVKSEDLNHHGTLYAGRGAEWFVEAGFIAAACLTKPENVLCLNIHGMVFKSPVRKGEVVRFEGKIINTGNSRLVSFVQALRGEETILRGFITFIHVDVQGKPKPHHIKIEPVTEQDKALQAEARLL
jgi:acyl-CoA hydrolase